MCHVDVKRTEAATQEGPPPRSGRSRRNKLRVACFPALRCYKIRQEGGMQASRWATLPKLPLPACLHPTVPHAVSDAGRDLRACARSFLIPPHDGTSHACARLMSAGPQPRPCDPARASDTAASCCSQGARSQTDGADNQGTTKRAAARSLSVGCRLKGRTGWSGNMQRAHAGRGTEVHAGAAHTNTVESKGREERNAGE